MLAGRANGRADGPRITFVVVPADPGPQPGLCKRLSLRPAAASSTYNPHLRNTDTGDANVFMDPRQPKCGETPWYPAGRHVMLS